MRSLASPPREGAFSRRDTPRIAKHTGMITALVRVERGVEALGVTLAALVPAVADGLIADAVVLSRTGDAEIATVADAAGASLVTLAAGAESWDAGPWSAGLAVARRDWLLCLDDGDVPAGDWARTVERFLASGGSRHQLARMRRRPQALGLRAVSIWERRFGTRRARAGDLVHRRFLSAGLRERPVCLPAVIECQKTFA